MSDELYKTEWLEELRKLDNSKTFTSTLDNVAKSGWEAMLISSETQTTSFAYTVGLYDTMQFPEIIVVGLKLDTAHRALQYAIDTMKEGHDLSKGRHREIVGEVEVEFKPVSQRWFKHVMCRADWYYGYGMKEIPILQLIYPDLKNLFQGEDGFNEYFRQPILTLGTKEGVTEQDFWAANDPASSLSRWKFVDPPHTSAILSKGVQERDEVVVFVAHNRNDATWEFLGKSMIVTGESPIVSCLHHPIDKDPSLEELHDLPLGWFATREGLGKPWHRYEEKE